MTELRQQLSTAELTYWMAFDRMEPIGDKRAEMHAALVASSIINVAGKTRKGKDLTIRDLMFTERINQIEPDARTMAAVPGVKVVKYGDS